jgi:predicted RNA-binding Zn-ribbon protein involved in translation (DUF1610 family)
MPQSFDKAARDEWLAKGKYHMADALAEPAMHNPDLLVPPTNKNPQTLPCTQCGAALAPFVVEHRLNCPHCGGKQEPIRWEGVMGSHTAAPIFQEQFVPPAQEYSHPNDRQPPSPVGWGGMQACHNCGHGMVTFEGQRGAVCPNCGNEEPIMAHQADASMPPQGAPVEPKETALPYNPSAYEGEVEGMHPAAQYTYQRAVAQGAAPQAAMAAAQEKQGEMMKRTQEGQNTEGVQIPVISKTAADDTDSSTTCKDCGKPMNPVEAMVSETHGVCGDCTRRKQKEVTGSLDRDGFVSPSTIERVSHLLS